MVGHVHDPLPCPDGFTGPIEPVDPLDDDRDDSAWEVDEEACETWARAYDELNGAPENDDDR